MANCKARIDSSPANISGDGSFEVGGGVEVEELARGVPGGAEGFGFEGAGERLEGELFLGDLAADDGEGGFAVKEAGEAEELVVGGEEGGWTRVHFF